MPQLNRRKFALQLAAVSTAASAGLYLANAKAQINQTKTTHKVRIQKFVFEPGVLIVRPGDKIEWANEDLAPHTATANDKSWDTGLIKGGESITLEVTEHMVSGDYYCFYHPHMKASLVLEKS